MRTGEGRQVSLETETIPMAKVHPTTESESCAWQIGGTQPLFNETHGADEDLDKEEEQAVR